MPYASAQDMRNRYPEKDLRELTSEGGEVVDDGLLDQALADASDEIDAYLMGRYVLPLASAPRVLTRYACEIAFYLLMKDRPQETVKDAKDRYDAAMKYFARVSRGEVQLGLASDSSTAPQSGGPIVVGGSSRTFSRDTLKGM